MEIRTLEYFLAVAREENMTEAANTLHITQPTLSRQIADLEQELGKQLFIRTNRNTKLTEEGIHLRQRAEEILSLVRQTESEISDDQTDLTGCIRLGAGETRIMHFLTDAFTDLHIQHPQVTCNLFTGNADIVEEKLSHGLIDFGLFIEPFDASDFETSSLGSILSVGQLQGPSFRFAPHCGQSPLQSGRHNTLIGSLRINVSLIVSVKSMYSPL